MKPSLRSRISLAGRSSLLRASVGGDPMQTQSNGEASGGGKRRSRRVEPGQLPLGQEGIAVVHMTIAESQGVTIKPWHSRGILPKPGEGPVNDG